MPDAPKWTPPPYANGADPEPVSGVFQTKTGKTRRRTVKQGAVLLAVLGLLAPLISAIVERISRPGPLFVVVTAPPQVDGGK